LNAQHRNPDTQLELWGGYECTVNRVGDQWFDQTLRSGHEHRLSDLQLFADLGLRSLRYPVLWERVSPNHLDEHDFAWSDERLPEIGRLGMNPIVTLCHHGSGPRYTSLVDPNFAPGLARHAAAVARRYPWVRDYTPVNEPLTTARFSALYGFWYPHTRDEEMFWHALLNEIDATRLAMRAIRQVRPDARLIQTDDLGFCHATPPLQAEADFQNERRWMGWDLLCGMVRPGHALWDRLVGLGLENRLRTIADDPCPPDVIGINHYLSSERLLDHRIALHGNRAVADRALARCDGIEHVDVDAVRSVPDQVIGLRDLIEQAWHRYGRPVAMTECHLGSTREDQARWFIEAWETACDLRQEGVDIRAVTAWSLLGAYDWNQMVTCWNGHYEPGVFDVRHPAPRPTLMARVLQDLSAGRAPDAPGLAIPGWWRDARAAGLAGETLFEVMAGPHSARLPRPLLILSDGGVFATLAAEACERRGLHYRMCYDDREAVIFAANPWAVFDARLRDGEVTVAGVQRACMSLNITAACVVLGHAASSGSGAPVLAAEVDGIFTADDEDAWPVRVLDALDEGMPVAVRADITRRDSYAPEVVDGMLDLLLDHVRGVVDFRTPDDPSEAAIALAIVRAADCRGKLLRINGNPAVSPTKAGVSCMPAMASSMERFVRECRTARLHGNRSKSWSACLEAAE
jgi:dTDP-4-dehydrorhamnose reductase